MTEDMRERVRRKLSGGFFLESEYGQALYAELERVEAERDRLIDTFRQIKTGLPPFAQSVLDEVASHGRR